MRSSMTLPEKVSKRHKPSRNRSHFSLDLLTIREFCQASRISYRQYFRIQAAGIGPRVTWAGGKMLISQDEAREWAWSRTESGGRE